MSAPAPSAFPGFSLAWLWRQGPPQKPAEGKRKKGKRHRGAPWRGAHGTGQKRGDNYSQWRRGPPQLQTNVHQTGLKAIPGPRTKNDK